ncbi:hypothetical protein ACFLTX_02820 [Chloroflexota bacterium]
MPENIPPEILKKSIAYFHLLSFCPPEELKTFKQSTRIFLGSLGRGTCLKQEEFFKQVVPQVFQRIVGFQQGSHQPDAGIVAILSASAIKARKSEKNLRSYQKEMGIVSELDARAKAENRLHRRKGCEYCVQPCRYGFFTLISEPRFDILQEMFKEESSKPPNQQSASSLVWKYTGKHLEQFHQTKTLPIQPAHFGNLAFCLLMLSMAKSRKAIPIEQIKTFQNLNQRKISGKS